MGEKKPDSYEDTTALIKKQKTKKQKQKQKNKKTKRSIRNILSNKM